MKLISWFVIVPCNVAALLTGLVQALGTRWGLIRHYWILCKFLLTIGATLLMLVHLLPIVRMSDAASAASFPTVQLRGLQIQLVADAGLALLVLATATTLAVYKPRGMTAFGRRSYATAKRSSDRGLSSNRTPRWVFLLAIAGLLLLFIGRHFSRGVH